MDLSSPVSSIKGVGDKTSALLMRYGFRSVGDLIYNLPRAYENYQSATKISAITPGKVVIKGKISEITTRRTSRRNFTVTEGVIRDSSDAIRVVWFNQPYRAKQFISGKEYYFSGEYVMSHGRYQLMSPSAELATDFDTDINRKFQPIYVAHGPTLTSKFFQKIMGSLRPFFANIPDLTPGAEPGSRKRALFALHFPENEKSVEKSREVLAYEELFELILASELNKSATTKLRSAPCKFNAEETRGLISTLPFKLTDAQRVAAWEILQDLEKPTPMNRLLQGDVGSGKTVVAAIAASQVIRNGHQVALLAPTAILATQHAESLHALLEPFGIRVALLTGATKHKDTLKKQIEAGNVDLVIGTHALLTDDTVFHSLALAIIDEQHRFGVEQRQKLLLKSSVAPHLLSMTATPIPRSLQLAIFGDLDVSTIATLPAGRQPITTKILSEIVMKESLYPSIREALKNHEQIYWICKAIDDNPREETVSVKKQAERLKLIFKNARVEFLHGRMKPAEKDQIMGDFAAGKIDILVSTTVVEVGVNVPNATRIVIMDAERYGLAQLHQLRGRVGRGTKPSACYLITPEDHAPSRRLRELEKSTDGFHLAEVDLELRGPGEIYGALQHGAMSLRIASLADGRLIARAGKAARTFAAQVAKDPSLMLQYKELEASLRHYQQLTTLN